MSYHPDALAQFFGQDLGAQADREQEVSLLFHRLNVVEDTAEQLLCRVSQLADEELTQLCQYAQEVGRQAWRIECACCAEIVARDEKRGAKAALIGEAAREMGTTATSIYRNAQVHALAESPKIHGAVNNLPDKTFFTEALHAPEPEAAVEMMAEKKANDPTYTTRQARQDVKALTQGATPEQQVEIYWLSIGLEPGHRAGLNELCRFWECDQQAAVRRMIENERNRMKTQQEALKLFDTFDAEAATQARDAAIAQVEAHTEPDWQEAALRAVRRVAKKMEYFTTDDIWRVLEDWETPAPHEPRAMGALMVKVGKDRIAIPTEEYRSSERVVHHRGPVRVWRSLLFGKEVVV